MNLEEALKLAEQAVPHKRKKRNSTGEYRKYYPIYSKLLEKGFSRIKAAKWMIENEAVDSKYKSPGSLSGMFNKMKTESNK